MLDKEKKVDYCTFSLKEDKEILKHFRIKNRFIIENQKHLVPQLFWGNLKDPKYVILGKNPSYTIEDEFDCKYFYNDLKKNLKIENHLNDNNRIINLLTNRNELFGLSYVAKWWQRSFSNLDDYKTNPEYFMTKVAIANIYGYYSKDSSPEKPFVNIELLNKSHIFKYIKELRAAIENAEIIFILWEDSIPAWEYILNNDCEGFFDKQKRKIYISNIKNRRNKILKIFDELKIDKCTYKSIKID